MTRFGPKSAKPYLVAGVIAFCAGGLATVAAAGESCCSATAGTTPTAHVQYAKASSDIVDTAKAAGAFNTLLAAAKAAGLVDALKADGPITVFAPTDDAFAKLPDGTLEALLDDTDTLRQILLLHVVPGKVTAKKALAAGNAPTLFGQPIYVAARDNGAFVDDAKIIKTDVMASNGVIHVIDSVMLPKSIAGIVAADDRFSTLLTAVKTAGLAETLSGKGPFTVFAPTNDAFAKLPAGTVETLLKPENKAKLTSILTYHVASGAVPAAKVVTLDKVKTLQGQSATVKVSKTDQGAVVMIDDAKVIITDIRADNGIIHVIDNVILPAD